MCPVDTYSGPAATSCVPCPTTSSASPGSTGAQECRPGLSYEWLGCADGLCAGSPARNASAEGCELCPEGYILSRDESTYVDYDECSMNNGGCDPLMGLMSATGWRTQPCSNTKGSFNCNQCPGGFEKVVMACGAKCMQCAPGKHTAGFEAECTECPAGKISSYKRTACDPCGDPSREQVLNVTKGCQCKPDYYDALYISESGPLRRNIAC